jgi:hypothetical protein
MEIKPGTNLTTWQKKLENVRPVTSEFVIVDHDKKLNVQDSGYLDRIHFSGIH